MVHALADTAAAGAAAFGAILHTGRTAPLVPAAVGLRCVCLAAFFLLSPAARRLAVLWVLGLLLLW